MRHALTISGGRPPPGRGITYQACIIANLQDLLGPETLVNPSVNLACVYAELEKLFSTLAPHAIVEHDVPHEIGRAADDCGCRDEMNQLRKAATDCRRGRVTSGQLDRVQEAVALATRFIVLLRTRSYPVRCPCGASMAYRFAETLDVVPPATHRLTCIECGERREWFIPMPCD